MIKKHLAGLAILAPLALAACSGSTAPATQEDPVQAMCRSRVNDDPAVQQARIELDTGLGQLSTARQRLSVALDNAMQKCLTENGARFRGGVERVQPR